jgi:hypothetical protein
VRVISTSKFNKQVMEWNTSQEIAAHERNVVRTSSAILHLQPCQHRVSLDKVESAMAAASGLSHELEKCVTGMSRKALHWDDSEECKRQNEVELHLVLPRLPTWPPQVESSHLMTSLRPPSLVQVDLNRLE